MRTAKGAIFFGCARRGKDAIFRVLANLTTQSWDSITYPAYHDPEICRWSNADSFASAGQGFVGGTMFALCLSRPFNIGEKTWQDAATLLLSGEPQCSG